MNEARHRIEEQLPTLEVVSVTSPTPPHRPAWAATWETEYQAFAKADRPDRDGIMAEARAAMVKWFRAGVAYGDDSFLAVLGIRPYANAPHNLRSLLEVASGRILANILTRKVPRHLIPEVLMAYPALSRDHVAQLGLKHELEADFGVRMIPLAYGVVYWTKNMPPERRAEVVSDNWYGLEARRLYTFVRSQYTKIEADGRRRATWQIDSLYDLQRTLEALNYDMADQAQYYACKLQDFKLTEVSSMLATLGVSRRPEAIRKSYWRQKQAVAEYKKTAEISGIVSHVKRVR